MITSKRIYAQYHHHHTSQHQHHSQQSSFQLPKLLMPQSPGPTPALQQTQTSVSAVVWVVVAAAAAAYLQVLCCVDSALPQSLAPLPSARVHHLQPPQLPQLACNRRVQVTRYTLHVTSHTSVTSHTLHIINNTSPIFRSRKFPQSRSRAQVHGLTPTCTMTRD
jgi:hypothetical protein